MRRTGLVALLVIAACSTDPDPTATQVYKFGPFSVPPGSEDTSKCVQITLHNADYLYVNTVELTTGPGFHHSNWFFVPEHVFAGDDGVFTCDDRSFNQATAGILGGVFFAQSTQSEHDVQQFPAGTVIEVPPHSKLVSTIHLLNTGEDPLELTPHIDVTPILKADVVTKLMSVVFEYHPIGIPAQKQSRVTVECEIGDKHQALLGRAPDFNMYYALAHYHKWGTRQTMEAVRPDGSATTIYSTGNSVGDSLGAMLDPTFSMSGYTKLRLSCDYLNNTDHTLYYANSGSGEMCVFLGFSDSTYIWSGGSLDEDPMPGTDINGVMSFQRSCQVFAIDGQR
ncbi:MAG TPA: hypothetical protein VMZ53_19470 [Kofleriaceae bacterium]|nr:hypothetical protein [Kofleriaceae bacterium]